MTNRRGDKTPLKLIIAGIRGWEASLRRMLIGESTYRAGCLNHDKINGRRRSRLFPKRTPNSQTRMWPRSASAADAARNVRCLRTGPICDRGFGPAGRQRDNPATARLFPGFKVAMDRLEVVAELLGISFAYLPHLSKSIVHLSLLPRPVIHQVCKSSAARSRSLGKQTRSDLAALRWQCACNSR